MVNRFLIILIILLIGTCSFSQDYLENDKYFYVTDSVYKEKKYKKLLKRTIKKTEKLLSKDSVEYLKTAFYYERAGRYAYYLHDYNHAITLLDKANKYYLVATDSVKSYEALFEIGLIKINLEELDTALTIFKNAHDFFANKFHYKIQALLLNNIGFVYYLQEQQDSARHYYRKALKINIHLNDRADKAVNLNNIGKSFEKEERFDTALSYYEKALKIQLIEKDEEALSYRLKNVGRMHNKLEQYDQAIDKYTQAIRIDKKLGKKENIANKFFNIGLSYLDWKNYLRALVFLEQSLEIVKELEKKDKIALIVNDIGYVYYKQNHYTKAKNYYLQALSINKKINNKPDMAVNYNNLGKVYKAMGQYDKALENYEEALSIDQKTGNKLGEAYRYNNIGEVYLSAEQYEDALKYFNKALAIHKDLGAKLKIAADYNRIGRVYQALAKYDESVPIFTYALDIYEELFGNVSKINKEKVVDEQMITYQNLAESYIQIGEFSTSLHTVELSNSKALLGALGEKGLPIHMPTIQQIKAYLPQGTAIMAFATIDKPDITQIFISNNQRHILRNPKKDFIDEVHNYYEEDIRKMLSDKLRKRFKRQHKDDNIFQYNFENEIIQRSRLLSSVVQYYLELVSIPEPTTEQKQKARHLGSLFYTYFFAPFIEDLETIQEIIFLPDGGLGYLPFETLVVDDTTLMVNRFDITYTPSISLLEMLKHRNYEHKNSTLLAVGGSGFSVDAPKKEEEKIKSIYSIEEVEELKKDTKILNTREIDTVSQTYSYWQTMGGNFDEIVDISKRYTNTKTITGPEAKEYVLKQLSAQNELKKYKYIHLSMKTIVVPELPILSAIETSQFIDYSLRNGEDGYLYFKELQGFDLQADNIFLSHCIYKGIELKGKGVCDFLQPFLVAGANSITATLWPMLEDNDRMFLKAYYSELNKSNKPSYKIINNIKRNMIKGVYGEKYKNPYYWASYVYYGKK